MNTRSSGFILHTHIFTQACMHAHTYTHTHMHTLLTSTKTFRKLTGPGQRTNNPPTESSTVSILLHLLHLAISLSLSLNIFMHLFWSPLSTSSRYHTFLCKPSICVSERQGILLHNRFFYAFIIYIYIYVEYVALLIYNCYNGLLFGEMA